MWRAIRGSQWASSDWVITQGVSRSHAASCMFLLSSPPSYEICFFQSNKICQTTCQTGKSFSWWYLPCFWGSSAVTLWTCLWGRYAWALSQNQSCMHMFVTLYNCIHLYQFVSISHLNPRASCIVQDGSAAAKIKPRDEPRNIGKTMPKCCCCANWTYGGREH